MTDLKLLAGGIAGAGIAAVCCFTPLLAVLLGAAGLSGWLGWLDYALLPALALFAGAALYALARLAGKRSAGGGTGPEGKP